MFWDFSRFLFGAKFSGLFSFAFFFQGLYVLLVILSS
jgi:hypothetical protein